MAAHETLAIRISIPGEPHAQGRARATVIAGRARLYDPQNSREWKAIAAHHMRIALNDDTPFHGPVSVHIIAIFTLPKSQHRKRDKPGRQWHMKKPDSDNIAKAVLDAGKGILWLDDTQVADVRVTKIIGAQGEAPQTIVIVMPSPPIEELLGEGATDLLPQGTPLSRDFWESPTIDELADSQHVQPLADVRTLFGTWPGESDDGFEAAIDDLRIIYSRKSAPQADSTHQEKNRAVVGKSSDGTVKSGDSTRCDQHHAESNQSDSLHGGNRNG